MLFHDPTKRIFNWIQQQPNVKEESITDWMLFELSERCHCLKYYAFTRHEETIKGADWEWWVLTTYSAYRFRVQAKKLKPTADNYSSICYSNKRGLQIELLIDTANQDAAFPLYIFYSAEKQIVDLVLDHYSVPILNDMVFWCRECNTGAFLSPAELVYSEVLDKPRQKLEVSALLNISLKLSCFDYLLRSPDMSIINDSVERHLNALHNNSRRGFRYEYNERNQARVVPHWLSYLSASKDMHNKLELSDWFEGEFRWDLPSVAGVAVLDLRQKKEC